MDKDLIEKKYMTGQRRGQLIALTRAEQFGNCRFSWAPTATLPKAHEGIISMQEGEQIW